MIKQTVAHKFCSDSRISSPQTESSHCGYRGRSHVTRLTVCHTHPWHGQNNNTYCTQEVEVAAERYNRAPWLLSYRGGPLTLFCFAISVKNEQSKQRWWRRRRARCSFVGGGRAGATPRSAWLRSAKPIRVCLSRSLLTSVGATFLRLAAHTRAGTHWSVHAVEGPQYEQQEGRTVELCWKKNVF